MAIIYIDGFQTAITAALAAEDTTLELDVDAHVALRAAAGGVAALQGDAGLMRVPMYLDDGTNVERVLVPIPPVEDAPVPIVRGAAALAFASGTVLRASPSAAYVAQGHEQQRYVAGNTTMAIPGEFVNWAPGFGVPAVTLLLPQLTAFAEGVLFPGESWPCKILVMGNYYGARTISLMNYSGESAVGVRVAGIAGLVETFDIPAGTAMALLELRRVAPDMRGNGQWIVTMELFPS